MRRVKAGKKSLSGADGGGGVVAAVAPSVEFPPKMRGTVECGHDPRVSRLSRMLRILTESSPALLSSLCGMNAESWIAGAEFVLVAAAAAVLVEGGGGGACDEEVFAREVDNQP